MLSTWTSKSWAAMGWKIYLTQLPSSDAPWPSHVPFSVQDALHPLISHSHQANQAFWWNALTQQKPLPSAFGLWANCLLHLACLKWCQQHWLTQSHLILTVKKSEFHEAVDWLNKLQSCNQMLSHWHKRPGTVSPYPRRLKETCGASPWCQKPWTLKSNAVEDIGSVTMRASDPNDVWKGHW